MIQLVCKFLFLVSVFSIINNCNGRNPSNSDVNIIEDFSIPDMVELTMKNKYTCSLGAIIRGDTTLKKLALIFSGDEFGDGGEYISQLLKKENIKASFFLTGNFYRDSEFQSVINTLIKNGNYMGSHSDNHLLYCDWINRDSLLLSKSEFVTDLDASYVEMAKFGIKRSNARFFLPPYEWYNDSIAYWTYKARLQLINFSPGTLSNADYTYPEMGNQYVDSKTIQNSILSYEENSTSGLNGFILLMHIGTDPRRSDKFYFYLPELIRELKTRRYSFVRIDELIVLSGRTGP